MRASLDNTDTCALRKARDARGQLLLAQCDCPAKRRAHLNHRERCPVTTRSAAVFAGIHPVPPRGTPFVRVIPPDVWLQAMSLADAEQIHEFLTSYMEQQPPVKDERSALDALDLNPQVDWKGERK